MLYVTLSREAIPIDKKVIALAVVCLLCAGIIFRFGFGTTYISGDRIGVDPVGADIQSAIGQQSDAIDRLRGIESGLDDRSAKAGELSAGIGDTAEAIADAQIRIDEGAKRTRTSQQLVDSGRRILAEIRKRGTVGH